MPNCSIMAGGIIDNEIVLKANNHPIRAGSNVPWKWKSNVAHKRNVEMFFIHATILPRIQKKKSKKGKWEKIAFHSNARYSVWAFENSPKILHTHNNRIARTHTTMHHRIHFHCFHNHEYVLLTKGFAPCDGSGIKFVLACVYSNNNYVFGAFL